ncbi:hypothetical protein FYK61_12880 [Xanthomonas citri]|uniref:AbiU2 domain-containing protein n=1 Tax=Xanthomonas citri TaxID=346 RepID=UPI001884AA29|nr:hypothetical protein [Xanthomonas citri]QOY22207.1 hypothetical protein FYK61_12880 [Xanthomonas citri]QQK68352.1 hypothetical protein G3566_12855 [Xanthomonas citri]
MPFALGVSAIDHIWRAIDYEVAWLHGRWAIYRQLFGTSETRVDVLNRSAGTFAHMLQDVLLDDVQLGLAKLGDPATTRIRGAVVENLTLFNLCQSVTASGALVAELPPLLAAYNNACAKARDRRNKRIAHFDLKTMLKAKASLRGPSREEIEVALEALRSVMNCIALHFTGTQTVYELIVLDNDGDSLIATLTRGLRYRELVEDGAIPHGDLRSSSWGKV